LAKAPIIKINVSPLSKSVENVAAVGVPVTDIIGIESEDVVLGAGGQDPEASGDTYSSQTELYDDYNQKRYVPPLVDSRTRTAVAYLLNCAVVFGGIDEKGASNIIEAYTSQYNHFVVGNLDIARYDHAAATVGDRIYVAGGNIGITPTDSIESFTTNFTKILVPIKLPEPVSELISANFAGHAIFAGGTNKSTPSKKVIAIDRNGNIKLLEDLSVARYALASAMIINPLDHTKQYLLFAGGFDGYRDVDTVDVYNQDLKKVALNIPPLSVPRSLLSGAGIGGYALFAGGFDGTKDTDVIDVYDYNLQKLDNMKLSSARASMGVAVVGEKAFFMGGNTLNEGPAEVTATFGWSESNEVEATFEWEGDSVGGFKKKSQCA
jgi:hypothetical protein